MNCSLNLNVLISYLRQQEGKFQNEYINMWQFGMKIDIKSKIRKEREEELA